MITKENFMKFTKRDLVEFIDNKVKEQIQLNNKIDNLTKQLDSFKLDYRTWGKQNNDLLNEVYGLKMEASKYKKAIKNLADSINSIVENRGDK